MKIFLISILSLLISANSFALQVEEFLEENQEKRAREIFLKVRCLACNGQVIENSDAEFSVQLRKSIRNKIKLGQSNQEIEQFLIKTYGPEILTNLDNKPSKLILWLLPFLLGVIIILSMKKTNYFSK